ncbi:MAG: thioredoxin family protein [Candidatus Lernaella stagnicola]|nr:thioredoxin family protein [Candidatus Lernaella stagnicola]
MSVLHEKDREKVRGFLEKLENPVRILFFTQEIECEYCSVTRGMLEEIRGLNDKISLEIYDIINDKEKADQYSVEHIPATILMTNDDVGVRFYGVPGGYEFMSVIEDLIDLSRDDQELAAPILNELNKVDKPVTMEVLVTPTCPYCARSVRAAHKFAMANRNIKGVMIDVPEFPEIGTKYGVTGVPHTVINGETHVVGALPEMQMAKKVLEAIGKA